MPACPLTLREREEIRAGIARDEGDGGIGFRLGRDRTTINREINRNGGRGRYSAVAAQARAERCRARPKVPKLVADPDLAAVVAERLEAKDSPQRISIELAQQRLGSISHETIYGAVYAGGCHGLPADAGSGLHLGRRRRKRRNRQVTNTNSLGFYCSIHDRPTEALERTVVGHLEGDLIIGAYNRSALITIFDRASRHLWLAPVAAKTADAVAESLTHALDRIPPRHRLSLTWDQGAEIAHHRHIAIESGIDIYIADPKSPWQRPTNEAGNALVRRYVGKGTNLNHLTTTDLRHIETRINTIPRRSLQWATAHHTYTAAVAMTD